MDGSIGVCVCVRVFLYGLMRGLWRCFRGVSGFGTLRDQRLGACSPSWSSSPIQFSRSLRHLTTDERATVDRAPEPVYRAGPSHAEPSRLESQKRFAASLVEMLPKFISAVYIHHGHDANSGGEIVLEVPPSATVPVLRFLRDHTTCRYRHFIDCCGVDFPDRPDRFRVVYNLQSLAYNARIRIQTYVNELTPLESATSVFKGADWFEREVYDMFGVFFTNHPDLRRILSDYGTSYHALRKDFPLSGYEEVRYDEVEKRVVYEPLEITQEFRTFDFQSPWEHFPAAGGSEVEFFRLTKGQIIPDPEAAIRAAAEQQHAPSDSASGAQNSSAAPADKETRTRSS